MCSCLQFETYLLYLVFMLYELTVYGDNAQHYISPNHISVWYKCKRKQ